MITEYVYNFSQDNKPVAQVSTGVPVKLKTLDCFSNQIQSDDQLLTDIGFDFERTNPATGPVFVEGAEPGDILVVDIKSVEVDDHGVVAIFPGIGPLHDRCEPRSKVLPIKDGKSSFNDVEFEINPMIGVIGVAPEAGKTVGCGYPGNYGGNMDCNKIVAGTRMYFPVNAAGALFQLGDLHAVMGDGELCGTGLEIAGEVTVQFDIIKNRKLEWPVLETEDKWYVISCALEYPDALREASTTLQRLLCDAYKWDQTDVYLYLSLRGDVEICQACKPSGEVDLVVRVGVPKASNNKGLL